MKLKFVYISFLVLLGCSSMLRAQTKPSAREIKQALKEAQYFLDGEDYLRAWQLYNYVLSADAFNEKAGVNAAFCVAKLHYPQDSAFKLAGNLVASRIPDAAYYLAKIKHKQKLFDEALPLLELCLKAPEKKRGILTSELNYFYAVCKSAKEQTAKPHAAVIKNMGPNINSAYDDYVPVIMPDESALYFTSKREGTTGNRKNGDNSYYEDVYVSSQKNGEWQKAENAGFPINTPGNDACTAISPDGHRMIVYRTSSTDESSGDLYMTSIGGHAHWSALKILGPEVNSEFIETSACFSKDSNEIYFSSNRPGGYGGKDIYRVKRLPNGRWATPFNLGPNVNTPYDDDAPFFHPDGVTMYFSSKGHNSMGEYDIFKCVWMPDSNRFGKAENLGYPINDVDNDVFFVLSVDGQRGYYSSLKKETRGGLDIYQIDTRFGENDLIARQCYVYLEGERGRAMVTLTDPDSNEIVGNFTSHPATGKFIMVVNPYKTYKIMVEEDGYTTYEGVVDPMVKEKNDAVLKIDLKKANAR